MASPVVSRVAATSIPSPNDVPNASPTDNPNGGSLNGNGGNISGAGQQNIIVSSSSSIDNSLPHMATSSFDNLPGASSTPTPTNLGNLPPASTTILSFNNTANFGTDITGRVFYTDMRSKLFSWTYDSSNTKLLDIFWYGKNNTGEPFNTSQATVIASAEFDGPSSVEFSKRMFWFSLISCVSYIHTPHNSTPTLFEVQQRWNEERKERKRKRTLPET